MDLFKHKKKMILSDLDPLICHTPLGDVIFQLACNDCQPIKNSTIKYVLESGSFLIRWKFKECEVEFFRADFMPKIPSDMKVDYCTAGIWRVRSLSSNLRLNFTAFIIPDSKIKNTLNEIPESGEGLICYTCKDNQITLSIGTEDEDYLIDLFQNLLWLEK